MDRRVLPDSVEPYTFKLPQVPQALKPSGHGRHRQHGGVRSLTAPRR